jgi:hypothetical protein
VFLYTVVLGLGRRTDGRMSLSGLVHFKVEGGRDAILSVSIPGSGREESVRSQVSTIARQLSLCRYKIQYCTSDQALCIFNKVSSKGMHLFRRQCLLSALAMDLWYHPRLISIRSPAQFRLGAQKTNFSLPSSAVTSPTDVIL